VLQTEKLTRCFGGLVAVNAVSLELCMGQVHAVIGPNGAGKSTLIRLLCGELPATSGSIRYRERELVGLPVHRIAGMGIGRSYQKTHIFPAFSVLENVRLAAQARQPRFWLVWRKATSYPDLYAAAIRALAAVDLQDRQTAQADSLSHGEQRRLELAMCLAGAPQVLLLDEPLAGMGAEESARMAGLIGRLKADHAILLVEHDMDAVFAVADQLTVMVDGRVIASGAPAAVRADALVQQAYLGEAA
jgi:branched-chain amino acid transport system ATP-binding protein